MREEFLDITHNAGIQTRIVDCLIEVSFEHIQNKESFLQEYELFGEKNNDIISQVLHTIPKEKDTTSVLILELLAQIYQKLAKIEHHIDKSSDALLPLQNKGVINALGHGIVCCGNAEFVPNGLYYLRFCLPNMPYRFVAVFGEAINAKVIKITTMHSSDIMALDSYIANKEMEYLRQKRNKND